ncbi:MAG: ACP S-malonyltransferase [Nitrospirota bacterium]|nr:ACP S-malonyltransferase [Nitrospirota bacterium]
MKTAFLFPGQGSQYSGMMDAFDRPEEKRRIDEASEILKADLFKISRNDPPGILDRTCWTQPAILVASILALNRLRGDSPPDMVLGHSLGEYTALVCASALSFSDAVRVVHERGRFMQDAVPEGEGLMAAVLGPEREKIEEILSRVMAERKESSTVGVANDNCPGQCVIAGKKETVLRAIDALKEAGVRKVVPLSVSVPSHTPLMHRAALSMKEALSKISLAPLTVPLIPNVTAQPIGPGPFGPEISDLLVRQLESPVEWTRSMTVIYAQGVTRCVEVGPGTVLTGLGKRIERSIGTLTEKILWESTDRKEEGA